MGRKPVRKIRNMSPQRREKYVRILLPVLQEYGLNAFTIDELAARIGISKATFYHHFTSKEEMISALLKFILTEIQGFEPILKDDSQPFADRYLKALQVLSDNVAGISNILLSDLREGYPQHWSLVEQFTAYATEELRKFYEKGMAAGEFNQMNTAILVLSDQIFLNVLSDPAQLKTLRLSLREALEAYFYMKCYGLLAQRPA